MRFNLNDLKILEYHDHVQRTWKGGFSNQNNLGTPCISTVISN